MLFAWDEKRSGDVVYAAGWNAKVRQLKAVWGAAGIHAKPDSATSFKHSAMQLA